MTILCLDTSGPVCSVAIVDNGVLRYEARVVNKLTHSVNLMPMLDEALNKSGTQKADLSHIAAVVGPGSFTGVRIAVAAAQGLAQGLGLPCLAVNALEAMAFAVNQTDCLVCPLRDARAGQVYAAAFLNNQRVLDDCALSLEDLLERLRQFNQNLYFLGDGTLAHHDKIASYFGDKARIAPGHLMQPGAAAAAMLAQRDGQITLEPHQLKPLYLRAPQAERLRLAKYE